MDIAYASHSTSESANIVQDMEWGFNVHYSFNPFFDDACMFVTDSHV